MEAGIAYAWEKLITVRTADLPVEHIPAPFRDLHADVVTDVDRVIIALGNEGSTSKRLDKETAVQYRRPRGVRPARPFASREGRCFLTGNARMPVFVSTRKQSIIVKAAIPNFGNVNFGTLSTDGTFQTNYISSILGVRWR